MFSVRFCWLIFSQVPHNIHLILCVQFSLIFTSPLYKVVFLLPRTKPLIWSSQIGSEEWIAFIYILMHCTEVLIAMSRTFQVRKACFSVLCWMDMVPQGTMLQALYVTFYPPGSPLHLSYHYLIAPNVTLILFMATIRMIAKIAMRTKILSTHYFLCGRPVWLSPLKRWMKNLAPIPLLTASAVAQQQWL